MDGCSDPTCKPPPCEFPPPLPKSYVDAGVKCCQFPPQTCRVSFSLPTQPDYVLDHNEPIVVEWPPKKEPICDYVDTGPRPDLLAQIPDQIAPQVVTMIAAPQMVNPSGTITSQVLQHERCPDGQLHVRIEPKQKKKLEIRMPPQEPPIRGPPCRPWTQCVENTLITDQVRRPLARCCHRREMPPLVIPTHKLEELKLKSTERQRKRAEVDAWYRDQECQRLKSRQRQAKWNFTVESLLDRKREKELAKEEAERESTRQLIKEVEQEKKLQSDAQIERANKLMLYRKGLIRDFHSALAYSKMMQEIEQAKSKSGEQDDSNCPMFLQKCYKKMMYPNTSRPDYSNKNSEEKKINQKLLQRLKCVEQRAMEQQQEINTELCCMKQLIAENMPELPEKYIKYISDPICDEDKKQRVNEEKRCDLFEEIGDKLAADAYIESHENEIDRQACEFNEYKRRVDAIRKAKEKELIDVKVAYNIAKSEAAAKVLVKMQQEKKASANEYDRLKDQWESEFEAKEDQKRSAQQKHMEKVIADFNRRKCAEGWKECGHHPARQWARERLVAVENFERECEEKSERRRKAEDVALYNKAQASNKQCHDQRKKYMDDVWAAKMKQDYVEEMKEMKSYAQHCIEDWKTKGRTTVPMVQAMKKWDYDSGMQPYLFAQGDAPLNLAMSKQMAKSAKNTNCPGYETTSKRLGFGSGGCS